MILSVGVRNLWPMAAILAAAGVGLGVVGLFVQPGVSLFTLITIIFLVAAVTVIGGNLRPTPVVSAGPDGITFWQDPAIPWSRVHTVLVHPSELVQTQGTTPIVQLVLINTAYDPDSPIDRDEGSEDPRVTGLTTLPGVLNDFDAELLSTQLQDHHPGLNLVDLRHATSGPKRSDADSPR